MPYMAEYYLLETRMYGYGAGVRPGDEVRRGRLPPSRSREWSDVNGIGVSGGPVSLTRDELDWLAAHPGAVRPPPHWR